MSQNQGGCRHNLCVSDVYKAFMDPMFDIPKDRKPLKVGRICVLLGLTVLLYLLVAYRYGDLVGALLAARVG